MKRVLVASVVAVLYVASVAWNVATAAPPAARDLGWGTPAVSGTVAFRERITIPGMAMVHVELVDVSGKDPRAAILGEQAIWPAGAPLPVTFRIAYDPSRVDPKHVYIVRAKIMDGEKMLFHNTTPYYVLTRGAPSTIAIIVVPARVR